MDSTNLPSTSTSTTTPASTSRTIPIQLTSTPATKIPEVHIKEIPETDEISEVSEISQSVCHVIKIRKLNRPSSMYNNVETNVNDKKETTTKVDSDDTKKSETIIEETAGPSNDDIKDETKASILPKEPSEVTIEPENVNPPQVEEMSLQKEEEKEEIDRIIPEPNLIGIKAVGIITACEGPDNVTSEEVSSINAAAPKESPRNPPSESGPPKSWIHKKRESLNSGSSQFDVSEIPMDVVETADTYSDAFILESASNENNTKNEKDEVNVSIDKKEDETSKPPKSPKAKVFVQVHSNPVTSSETVIVAEGDEQKVDEPIAIEQPETVAATSVSTKVYDFKIESSHEFIEPQDIQVTNFEVAEAVSTKQSNSNPIIEDAQIVKTSESHPEEINVVQYRDEKKPVEQLSPSKADLIPHESLEDKIHVPKDRPKSAASLEHEHKHEKTVEIPKIQETDDEKPALSNIQIPDKESTEYNPMDDPHSPDYRPFIHQSSFEIPIIFEKKSTGEGPVRTGFTVDELPWEQDVVSESAKSENNKVAETVSTKRDKEEAKGNTAENVGSAAKEEQSTTEAKLETEIVATEEKLEDKKQGEITKQNGVDTKPEIAATEVKDEKIEEKTSASIVDEWQALEDIDEEPLEPHILEKIPEEPQQTSMVQEKKGETPQESLLEKKHEEIQSEKPPPTEPPKIDEEVNIHFPLEKSLEESNNKRTPPPTTKPNADSVIRTISESSPEHDEDTTYYSISTQNTVTQEDILIDPEEEKKVVEEAVEVQKRTERMISEDNDESISTSFYSVSEKLSSKSEEDREKTPEATEKNKMNELKYENKQYENIADLMPHKRDKIHVPHDKPKPAAMLEHEPEKDNTVFQRRQIPVIIETKSAEIDGDDIDVTVEDATADEENEKPQVILRKDKQRQNSEDTNSKPIVAVAPTSRTFETEKERQEEKKEETQVLIGVTRPTSVIRTDENDDSEAPLIRVKRKDLAELEDILGENEIKVVEKHEHKFDELIIKESSKSPLEPERKPSTPFYDESETSEVPIKYRNREAKLIQRLSEQSTTANEESSSKLNGIQERNQKQTENLFPKQQNGISESSKKASMTESMIRDLREVNHELTHGPKSPSPGRHDECLSPRTLTRFHNPSVIFEKDNDNKNEGGEVIHHHPVFVKDTSKYWYKPTISREEAINMLRDKSPGTFVVRDSNSFPGAFGLALKVAKPPDGVLPGDGSELVRHFLIEPSSKGVKLKGCNNEPVFGTLAALVYQHSITPMALPCRLLLPEYDPASTPEHLNAAQALLEQGAACNVTYIYSFDTESLTGPEAVRRAVHEAMEQYARGIVRAVNVHFKVSSQGITLTDNTRTLFFRRHYPTNSVIYAGIDPEDRKWDNNSVIQLPTTYVRQARVFGFVARKISTKADNACHVFAELDPEQPATAVVNFITKVMMGNSEKRGRTLPPV
jgi:hypothetical protein